MKYDCWDIHNHMLPGLDDGASCMDETFELVKASYEQGIRNLIFTPHYRQGMFEIDSEEQKRVYLSCIKQLQMHYPDMKFYLGCEFYVHRAQIDMLSRLIQPYCLAGLNVALVEFSPGQSFFAILRAVKHLKEHGIIPIIAHVERYQCLSQQTIDRVRRLGKEGSRIQINAGSVIGKSGFSTSRFCKKLLKENLVDFIASDAHDIENRKSYMGDCLQFIEKRYGKENVEKIFVDNPSKLFGR